MIVWTWCQCWCCSGNIYPFQAFALGLVPCWCSKFKEASFCNEKRFLCDTTSAHCSHLSTKFLGWSFCLCAFMHCTSSNAHFMQWEMPCMKNPLRTEWAFKQASSAGYCSFHEKFRTLSGFLNTQSVMIILCTLSCAWWDALLCNEITLQRTP
jgi:hypothetical protein